MNQSKLMPKLLFAAIVGVTTFMFIGFVSSLFISRLFETDTNQFFLPKGKIKLLRTSLLNLPLENRKQFIVDVNKNQLESYSLAKSGNPTNCRNSLCKVVFIDESHQLIIDEPAGLLEKNYFYEKHKNIKDRRRGHNKEKFPRGGFQKLLMTLGVQFVAMTLYIVILMFLIFYYSRKRREVGEEVFEKIKEGALDTRFPVSKVDDFGTNTKLFNEMADEIMSLVLKLRKKDENRKLLFKTLAHDLKTPAASLKGIMETLTLRKDELTEQQQSELYKMSSLEIDYFSALLDDILFLAKVQDPEFKSTTGRSEVVSSVRELCDSISFINKKVDFSFTSDVEEVDVALGHSSLMRLFRNAIDNAFLYCEKNVQVSITLDKSVVITIFNDGAGFDAKMIESFGTIKSSRTRTNAQGSLSFGMGAVIMSALVESIEGDLHPENVLSDNGSVLGAKLTIELPILTS